MSVHTCACMYIHEHMQNAITTASPWLEVTGTDARVHFLYTELNSQGTRDMEDHLVLSVDTVSLGQPLGKRQHMSFGPRDLPQASKKERRWRRHSALPFTETISSSW